MIKIYIFADSHKHFTDAVSEYKKRLWKQVEVIELKPVKKWTSQQIIEAETKLLQGKLDSQNWYKVVLSPNGKNISTDKFREIIENQKNSGNHVLLALGWANGLDYSLLKSSVDFELSLGQMILPHSLAFTILLEQIYRCSEIERGSSYHK